MTKALIKLQDIRSEKGATAVEYGLMIALIAMAIFGTVLLARPQLGCRVRRGR